MSHVFVENEDIFHKNTLGRFHLNDDDDDD